MNKKGKHQHVDKELRLVLSWLEGLTEVKRIFVGVSESARHSFSPGYIRWQSDIVGGIRIMAYSGSGVVKISIITDHKQELIEKIKKRFP